MIRLKKWGVLPALFIGVLIAAGLAFAQQRKYGGTLVVGTVTDIVGIDPHKVTGEISMIVLNTMYERLVDRDEKSMPMPGLASKWTVSSDGLVYTFHLRQEGEVPQRPRVDGRRCSLLLQPAHGPQDGGIAKWEGSGLQNHYSPVRIRMPPQ